MSAQFDKHGEAWQLLYDHFHASMSKEEFEALLRSLAVPSQLASDWDQRFQNALTNGDLPTLRRMWPERVSSKRAPDVVVTNEMERAGLLALDRDRDDVATAFRAMVASTPASSTAPFDLLDVLHKVVNNLLENGGDHYKRMFGREGSIIFSNAEAGAIREVVYRALSARSATDALTCPAADVVWMHWLADMESQYGTAVREVVEFNHEYRDTFLDAIAFAQTRFPKVEASLDGTGAKP